MKNSLINIILWSVGLVSCASQKAKPSEKVAVSIPITPIEIVKDSTCCFDIKRFEVNAYKQELFKENFKKPGYDAQYKEDLNNKNIRQWTVYFEDEKANNQEYVEEISQKWSPFNIQKRYNNLGRMKFWGIFFRNEGINKSYEYDENGKVIKVTDYEEKFKHSFADIREYLLKEKGIDIYDTRQAIARRVNHRNETPSRVYYDISVLDKNNEEKDYKIIISDDTLELKEYH